MAHVVEKAPVDLVDDEQVPGQQRPIISAGHSRALGQQGVIGRPCTGW